MANPKKSKSPHRKRKYYVAPKPQKPVVWVRVGPGLAMLRYTSMPFFVRATDFRRIKNSSACVVAPVYAAVEEFPDWSTALLEDVFHIGNEVHRLTLQQLKLRRNSSFPIQCVCPSFLLNLNRVTILVRQCYIAEPLRSGVIPAPDNAHIQVVDKILSDNHGMVLQLAGKTYAFWKDNHQYFSLVPEGFRDVHNRVPVLLKSKDLRVLLNESIELHRGVCSLFSVKVLNKTKISMALENVNEEFNLPEPPPVEEEEEAPAEEAPPEPAAPDKKAAPAKGGKAAKAAAKKKEEVKAPVEEVITEDQILTFSTDFVEIDKNRGILMGKEYCSDPDRIPHTLISAAVFVHHFPANVWTSVIIKDIMKFSKKIYNESDEDDLLESENWIERIKFPVKLMKTHLYASFDKLVFGTVISEDPNVLGLAEGLKKFFDTNDTGIIAGPQMVLVWQQKSNLFMFDPKERDGLGRKWTRMYSAELGSTALAGSACVTWYRSTKTMADVYIETVAIKHRKDPYKIVKLTLFEQPPKVDDEGEWIGTADNRWILFGNKSICDYSYADDTQRQGKALCMAVASIMAATDEPEYDWDIDTIDKILADGIELFKQSIANHPADTPFTLNSIKSVFEIEDNRYVTNVIECKIRGAMGAELKTPGSVMLKNGLSEFFNSANSGIFTVKDVILGIWRGEGGFIYLFYPYEKPVGPTQQCLCENESSFPPMGMAHAIRFNTISDLFSYLKTKLNTKDVDEYCLSPLVVEISDVEDRPPTYEYEEFGETGAILRPYDELNEGHEMFGVRADKQTIANLLIALGFNRINSSRYWRPEDVADILHIGDRIFCKIYMSLPECQARDYRLQWDDVVPVIGVNKFTFTREEVSGYLELMPEIMEEEAEHDFVEDEEEYEVEEGVEAADEEVFVRPVPSYQELPPPPIVLKKALKDWDEQGPGQYHEAILITDFYKIAIWKREDLYYIFDPKASGEEGELTERRLEKGKDQTTSDNYSIMAFLHGDDEENEQEHGEEAAAKEKPLYLEKRVYDDFDNDGSAYVMWFQSYDEFFKHIKSLTPEEYKYGKFTLHLLELSSAPLSTGDIGFKPKVGFQSVAPGQLILRGSISQSSPNFANHDKQELCNLIVAMALAKTSKSSQMTTTLIDMFLKYGDRLYSKSAEALKKKDLARYKSLTKLELEDILPVFRINKIQYRWTIKNKIMGNFVLSELKKATNKIGTVEGGLALIFSHKGFVMAFWRSEGGFYLYDPYETNPSGIIVPTGGLPSFSKFDKIDTMLNYILGKYVCFIGMNTYTLHMIGMESTPEEELKPAVKPAEEDVVTSRLIARIPNDQTVFQPYENNMKILRSSIYSVKIPEYCLALAALILNRLQVAEMWNTNVSYRISFLSRYLMQKSECELELLEKPVTFDETRSSFIIDNEFTCHISYTKKIQGPILSSKRTEIVGVNLKNALTMFFRTCRELVLFFPGTGYAFALWTQNAAYFLFGIDRLEQDIFVISAPTLLNIYEVILKDTNPEEDLNNWYELRSVSLSVLPIHDTSCKKLKTIEYVEDGPLATKSGAYISRQAKEPYYFDHVAEKPEGVAVRTEPTEFVQAAHGVEILSGDVMKCHKFYGTSSFFASLQATCVEAAVLARVKSPALWTKKTLEHLLNAGINLYVNTVAVKGSPNIQIVDFKGNFYLSNYKLEVDPLPPTVQSASKNELLKCLAWIIRKYQTAYLYSENFCFTLMLENGDCYLYFPGSDKTWKNHRTDCSCLIKFCTISDLLDRLLENEEISQCENIRIGPIVFQN